MSIGPTFTAAGLAGAPLAQTKGSEIERAQQDSMSHQRRVTSDAKANDAAGIAATDGEDTQPQERDADGRRLWEKPLGKQGKASTAASNSAEPRQSKDPQGQSGSQLDLTG